MNNLAYLGNANLSKKGTKHGYTKEQLDELKRCRDDIIYFAEKYFTIINMDLGKIKIPLYSYQKELLHRLQKYRFNIVTQARQSGKTTTNTVFILHYILFHENKNVAILANKGATSREILSRIKLAFELLPLWMKPGIDDSWNMGTLKFDNGCKIMAAATSSSSIRGEAIALLVVDECAFVENWDEFYKSTYPTISSGKTSKVVLISTVNGLNHFHHLWKGSTAPDESHNKNEFEPFEVRWYDVPGRDEAWKKQTIANTSEEAFMQEHENVFLGGQNTLISTRKLRELISKEILHINQCLKVYEEPVKGHPYIITVDTSHGKGLDYSTISVSDIHKYPFQQVAVFRDNEISPLMYHNVIYELAIKYNKAYVLIENNDIGSMVVQNMNHDLEYENLLSPKTDRAGKYELGIRMTASVKAIGCSNLRDLIENDKYIVNDQTTIEELSSFTAKGKSYEAEEGATDDIVMTLVMFAWFTDTPLFKDIFQNTNIRLDLFKDRIENIMEDLVPFGIIDNGILDPDDPEFDTEMGMYIVHTYD